MLFKEQTSFEDLVTVDFIKIKLKDFDKKNEYNDCNNNLYNILLANHFFDNDSYLPFLNSGKIFIDKSLNHLNIKETKESMAKKLFITDFLKENCTEVLIFIQELEENIKSGLPIADMPF